MLCHAIWNGCCARMNRVYFHCLFAALVVIQLFNSSISSIPVPPTPTCWVEGRPQRMVLLASLPRSSGNDGTLVYNGHYCYPNITSRFCMKPAITGYKKLSNCTVTSSDSHMFRCNMTELIYKLHPNLVDPHQPSRGGYQLCMVISATNDNGTTYSKSKCCDVSKQSKPTILTSLQAIPYAKRQVTLSWRSPYEDPNINAFLRYVFYLSSEVGNYTTRKKIRVTPSNRTSRNHFHVITNLQPYTRYKIWGTTFMMIAISIYDIEPTDVVEFRTLAEAPSSPPTITGVQPVGKNSTEITYRIEWEHPQIKDRNGVISKTVIEYQKSVNHINDTMPGYVSFAVAGNKTMVLIVGMDVHANFVLTLRSCTVGCGIRSTEYMIKGLPPKSQASERGSTNSSLILMLSLVFLSVASAILATVCLVYWIRRSKRKRDQAPPPPLPEVPVVYDDESDINGYPSFDGQQNEYAHAFIQPEEANHSEASIVGNDEMPSEFGRYTTILMSYELENKAS